MKDMKDMRGMKKGPGAGVASGPCPLAAYGRGNKRPLD
jgi:hypothetical protein